MFKLTIIAGPKRGSSYALKEGAEVSVGRHQGNVIVLDSSKISKRHCKLVVNGGEVVVEDQGSSNGIFVNGVMAKRRHLSVGDRLTLGEYVFELSSPKERQAPMPLALVPSNGYRPPASLGSPFQVGSSPQAAIDAAAPEPVGPKGKFLWWFEKNVMPFFYALHFEKEWRTLVSSLVVGLVIAAMVLSMSPIFDSAKTSTISEIKRRASLVAQQIVERNALAMANRQESRTEIGTLGDGEGIKHAFLTDLDRRIIAPASNANRSLIAGSEGRIADTAAKRFRAGRETGVTSVDGDIVVAIEPLKVYNPQTAKNVVVAMAIVSIDASQSIPGTFQMMYAYGERFIFVSILALLASLIIYRLTLRPFQVLGDDLDRALKGDIKEVTHEFKIEELNSLWDMINSLIQRARSASNYGGGGGVDGMRSAQIEDFAPALLGFANFKSVAMVVLDSERKILGMTSVFEDITGLRFEQFSGQVLDAVARDSAFSALCRDIFERAQPGVEAVQDEFEFNGVAYHVRATALGGALTGIKGYTLWLELKGEHGGIHG